MPGIIIVGAGPLIGRSVAQRFAREGLPVAVVARSQATVDETLAAVGDGVAVAGFAADATDEPALRSALDQAVAAHGVPDVVVYNAALIRPDALGELSAQELLDTLAVNVVGAVTTAAHVGPAMRDNGGGTLIITSGMPDPVPSYFSLSLGKAGVRSVAALLAAELGPGGVHVATVTVCDVVARGTAYDPDLIAESYWDLHQQAPSEWQQDVLYQR